MQSLTGRESLTRLIGKRRRFLPNRHALLSIPIQSSLTIFTDEKGKNVKSESVEKESEDTVDYIEASENDRNVVDMSTSDLVTCPVCGNKVRSEDYMINSHLDSCLSRGTKRKMTQRTLLQLNFGPRPKICSQFSDRYSQSNVVDDVPDKSFAHNATNGLPYSDAVEENDGDKCTVLLNSCFINQTCMKSSTGNPVYMEKVNCMVDIPLLSAKKEVNKQDMDVTVDGISGWSLETYIVGRRFSDEKDLNIGMSIYLLKDPDNVKDPNAIKVLSADSAGSKVLGYLPRELAQYLSPLIADYQLSFEGCVISVPKHSPDVVPIQIACHNKILNSEEDYQAFNNLWKDVVHVVECLKNYPPKMTKYQQNFSLLIQEVLRCNPRLFTDDEKKFMDSFTSLSDDSQRLFVRLYTRKGPWFRLSNISYTEVSDSQLAVRGLCVAGYLCSLEDMNELLQNDIKDILNLLTCAELREISSILKKLQNCNRSSRKQDILTSLLDHFRSGLCPLLRSMILDRTVACIRISSKAESLIWRAERLFFLNGEQDLSAFLLVDLGIVKYPSYNCIVSEEIFSCRTDLLAYEEAIEVAQVLDESLDENNIELVLRCIMIADSRICSSSPKATRLTSSELVAPLFSCFSALWVYSKVLTLGVSFLERDHRYDDAINLLKRLLNCFICDGRRGYWMLRLSIDLEHTGSIDESLSVAENSLSDPWVRAGSRMALQKRILRLGKPPRRWKTPSFSESVKRKIPEVHIQGRPLNCETGKKSRFYGEDGEQCGVEQLALQYYAGEGGWQGVHTESGIWLTIFALLMWDILFSDSPNVFRTRFQTAPLDLDTDSFYIARKTLIESQLQRIYDGMAEEILITSFETHVGTACRGVNWDRHSLSELRAAATCIGGPCLASLCRHLAQDYRSWASGMPDLLLWRFHGDYGGEAKLVEVKGPKDRLSEQQRAWLLLLMDCGFHVEVCKVSPILIST